MRIIITVETGEGEKSTEKDIDKTVDLVMMIGSILEKKFKGFTVGRCKCMSDGISLILEK